MRLRRPHEAVGTPDDDAMAVRTALLLLFRRLARIYFREIEVAGGEEHALEDPRPRVAARGGGCGPERAPAWRAGKERE